MTKIITKFKIQNIQNGIYWKVSLQSLSPRHLFPRTEVAIIPISDLDTSRSSLCMHSHRYIQRWNTRQLLKWTQLFYMWWYRRIICINMPCFSIFCWWAWYSFLFYSKCYSEHWVYVTFHLCLRGSLQY